jgi:hypothetical protein
MFESLGCDFSHRGEARVVRMAVQQWQTITASSGCPAYAELVHAGVLDTEVSRDAGADFRIACASDDISVLWTGPDRKFGTLDDVAVPDPIGNPPPLTISKLGSAQLAALPLALFLAGLAILATLLALPVAAYASRAASITGWLVILVCLGCGLLDTTAAHIAASRRGLSPGDAERCRSRGNQSLLWEAALGAIAGTPGALLVPFGVRRRIRRGGVESGRG